MKQLSPLGLSPARCSSSRSSLWSRGCARRFSTLPEVPHGVPESPRCVQPSTRRRYTSGPETRTSFSRQRILFASSFPSSTPFSAAYGPSFVGQCHRFYQQMAAKPETPPTGSKTAPDATGGKPPPAENPSNAQQRRMDWKIVKRLMVNVWPKNDWKTRLTVLLGFFLLVSAKVRVQEHFCKPQRTDYCFKVLNVQVPQIFKNVIDSLNVEITDQSTVWILAGSMIIGCLSFHITRLQIFMNLYRWSSEGRCNGFRRAPQRSLCQHWATSYP